jgi:hypothetical protein
MGRAKSVPNSEVSSFHRAICTENSNLGPDEVSLFHRMSSIRRVVIHRFHCIAKTMQTRMQKLRTRTQQTPASIVTAWCAACATLECVTKRWKRSDVENFDCFLLPQHFCHSKFPTKRCTECESAKSSTSNSMKARDWVHQVNTTWWLDNRHWAYCSQCPLTFFE